MKSWIDMLTGLGKNEFPKIWPNLDSSKNSCILIYKTWMFCLYYNWKQWVIFPGIFCHFCLFLLGHFKLDIRFRRIICSKYHWFLKDGQLFLNGIMSSTKLSEIKSLDTTALFVSFEVSLVGSEQFSLELVSNGLSSL